MTLDEITQKVDATLARVFRITVNDIASDMSYDTHAEWDSAAYLMVILALEEQFEIQFAPEEIEDAMGRRKLIEALAARLTGQPSEG